MRKLSIFKYLVAAGVVASAACSTTQHDAVQFNQPAPEVMRGAALSPINSSGPASMTTASTEALAMSAERANRGGTFLGYIEATGPSPSGNTSPVTGQVIPPSLYANPEITVNSSISSGPNPIITSGAGEGGGLFIATAAAPVATNAGVTSAAVAAPITTPITTSGVTSTTVAPITNGLTNGFTGAAPIIATSGAIATPTNTASVLSAGQFAAGPGGVTNTGATPIVSSSPLAAASGNTLVNANTGTLTPTVSSSVIPSPTLAANQPVVITNNNTATRSTNTTTSASTIPTSGFVTGGTTLGATAAATGNTANAIITNGGTRFAIGPQGMTSSSTITNTSANVTSASNATTSSTTSSTTSGARLRAVNFPSSGTNAPVTQPATSSARRRSVTTPASQTASDTVPASRQRAIRVTTSSNGTPVVTNVNDNAFMQRAGVRQRDQVAPRQ